MRRQEASEDNGANTWSPASRVDRRQLQLLAPRIATISLRSPCTAVVERLLQRLHPWSRKIEVCLLISASFRCGHDGRRWRGGYCEQRALSGCGQHRGLRRSASSGRVSESWRLPFRGSRARIRISEHAAVTEAAFAHRCSNMAARFESPVLRHSRYGVTATLALLDSRSPTGRSSAHLLAASAPSRAVPCRAARERG